MKGVNEKVNAFESRRHYFRPDVDKMTDHNQKNKNKLKIVKNKKSAWPSSYSQNHPSFSPFDKYDFNTL